MLKRSKWFPHVEPRPAADLRLFCLPYGGASASLYKSWSRDLPNTIELVPIELPGHGTRLKEPTLTRMAPLVEQLSEAIHPHLDKTTVIYGHSLGALIGFELACSLRRQNMPMPSLMIASGMRAPQLPFKNSVNYNLPKKQFYQRLRELNGTPKLILESAEMMELMIPILRSDFELNETYKYTSAPPLEFPIHVFGGENDKEVSREELEAWSLQTISQFSLSMFPGNHFFLHAYHDKFIKTINNLLHSLK